MISYHFPIHPLSKRPIKKFFGFLDFAFICIFPTNFVGVAAKKCLVVRNSATRRYFSLLFLESLYYFYLNMGLYFQGKRPKKGEIFRDPEPIAFFSFAHSNEGEFEWRNQHRPSKDTWIRPVQSRTSSMILTNDYQRTINLVREILWARHCAV